VKLRTHPHASKPGQREKRLVEGLSAALSAEEIRGVLVAALLTLDGAGRERLYGRLAEETSAVLRALLEKGSSARQRPALAATAEKIRERWTKLWGEWSAAVGEASAEDGRYVIQEHHWEPPYLDASGLARDLDPIAAGMRGLLVRAVELGLEPGLGAAEVLEDLDDEVCSGLPDWMDVPEEDCELGPAHGLLGAEHRRSRSGSRLRLGLRLLPVRGLARCVV